MVGLFLCVTFALRGESLSVIYLSRCLKLPNSEISWLKRLQIEAFKVMQKNLRFGSSSGADAATLEGIPGQLSSTRSRHIAKNRIVMAYKIRWAFETGSRNVSITTTWFAIQTSAQEVMILWLSTWHSLWVTPWPKRSIWCFHGWGKCDNWRIFAKTKTPTNIMGILQRQIFICRKNDEVFISFLVTKPCLPAYLWFLRRAHCKLWWRWPKFHQLWANPSYRTQASERLESSNFAKPKDWEELSLGREKMVSWCDLDRSNKQCYANPWK